MNAVVDANLVAALALPLPYSEQATQKMVAWKGAGVQLHAPLLLEYEVASVFRKAVVVDIWSTGAAAQAMNSILALNIRCWPPTFELHERALGWAERLGQSKAYDAQYLALAEDLHAELWTADRQLARSARQAGVDWVCWLGERASTESQERLR
jgi:predicted nucleic acid-binding protein